MNVGATSCQAAAGCNHTCEVSVIQMIMKKLTSTIGWVCVVCFLSCLVTAQAIASDAVPSNKTAQSMKSKKMKLEELVQKLENANPWSIEKVSEALGTKLTPGYSNQSNASYVANRLEYGEGLIVNEVRLRLSIKRNNEMIRLILGFAKDAACLTHEHLKEIYPSMDYVLPGPLPSTLEGHSPTHPYRTYEVKRPWGDLFFKFYYEQPNCLAGITFAPPEPSREPIVSDNHKMKLEELLQRAEAAIPWTAEKVSKALGAEFEYSTSQNGDFSHYEDTRDPADLRYEENLFLSGIRLRTDTKTSKAHWLILEISSRRSRWFTSGCFTLDRIKKSYPDIEFSPTAPPPRKSTGMTSYYKTERPWGRLSFGFNIKSDCLSSIVLTPNQ